MGRLVGIELENFKSYRGLARVGFGTSSYFTSIIGPNGSGKSNMMDAISFVLGVRSNQLRSNDLKSLIYRGAIDLDEDNGVSGEEALSSTQDPDSAYVKAIYVKENGDTLEFKREITASGSCIFTINGASVTVSQYSQVLKEENILIKARNFLVFQGDVEKVASQSPAELTNMIETISGSVAFKKEFDDLQAKSDSAHDDTTLKNLKRKTIKEEINLLTSKCKEVDLYDKKIKELEILKANKYLVQLYKTETSLENAQKEFKANKKALKDIDAQIKAKTIEYREFIETQTAGKASIKSTETEIESKELELRQLKTDIIPFESKCNELKRKISDYQVRIETLKSEAESQNETIQTTEATLDDIKAAYDIFNNKLQAESIKEGSSQTDNSAMLSDYNTQRQEFLLRAGYLESQLRDLSDERTSIISQIDNLKNSQNLINNRVQEIDGRKTNAVLNNSEIKSKLNSTKLQITNLETELVDLQSKKNELGDLQIQLNQQLKVVLQKLTELNAARRETAREKKIREISSTLKRVFPGVRGILHDIIRPKQRKHNTALAALLGKDLDSIIVDTLATAQECINYMKIQRLGVASFIPLSTIKVVPLDVSLREIHSQAMPAIDTLSLPAEFEKVGQYICGNSLICDTIEVAMSLKWNNPKGKSLKLVTLDGSLIHKSGLMTGGMSDSTSKRWNQSEWSSLNAQKEELKSQFERLKDQMPDDFKFLTIGEEIENLKQSIPEVERSMNDSDREIADFNKELNHEKTKFQGLESELMVLQKDKELIDQQFNTLKEKLVLIQDEVYHEFCSKYSMSSIEEYESKYGAKLVLDTKQDMRFRKEIQNLQQRVEFEKERLSDYNGRIERLCEDKLSFEEKFALCEESRSQTNSKIDTVTAEIEVLKEDYDQLKVQIRVSLSEETNLKTDLVTLKSDLKFTKKKFSQFEEVIETINMNRMNILSNSVVEGVKLPLLSGSLDDLPINNEDEDMEESPTAALDGIEIDYETIEDNNSIDLDDETVEESIRAKIEALAEQLKDMNPDARSRERLDAAKVKFKEAEADFKASKEVERELMVEFNKVRDKRYKTFMLAFEHISDNINEVYQDLTKSANDDGGSAYLTLENDEDPYLDGIKYQVKLPTKRFQEMSNLSGGEKTVAALALLFAVHSYHPSPFFVLDEVDAALDNANVGKIANYIAKHKGPNFQFIIISLKNSLFEQSDTLVGIYRDQDVHSSKVMTMDLRPYDD